MLDLGLRCVLTNRTCGKNVAVRQALLQWIPQGRNGRERPKEMSEKIDLHKPVCGTRALGIIAGRRWMRQHKTEMDGDNSDKSDKSGVKWESLSKKKVWLKLLFS